MKLHYFGILAVTALVGCASSSPTTTSTNSTSANDASASTAQAGQSGPALHRDPANVLSQKRSVFFGLDEYALKDEHRSVVQMHSEYLSTNPKHKVRIEGNTDEQGSREYNLALGQKRAHTVKNAMTLLGVHEGQVEVISWGEEKPRALGQTEADMAQNRRADIKYSDEN